MNHTLRSRPFSLKSASTLILSLSIALFSACRVSAAQPELTVAIAPDIPPYVMDKAASGIEVDILRQALPDRVFKFKQIPYDALLTAVPQQQADIALSVERLGDDGAFYSDDYIGFANVAAFKKTAAFKIDSIADLADHTVLAWQEAYLVLGPEFKNLFAPGSPRHGDYHEFGDQGEQVRKFWQDPADVIVIDRSIFSYFSTRLGHSLEETELKHLFPAVTPYKAAFKDAALRDAFNQGLRTLCENGGYAKLLANYHFDLSNSICNR
ncbi:MAG: substrate-binding periplasmic protein [Gammaproteobacteria bacterium]